VCLSGSSPSRFLQHAVMLYQTDRDDKGHVKSARGLTSVRCTCFDSKHLSSRQTEPSCVSFFFYEQDQFTNVFFFFSSKTHTCDLKFLFQLLLHLRSLTTITHSLVTIEYMDSFGTNSKIL